MVSFCLKNIGIFEVLLPCCYKFAGIINDDSKYIGKRNSLKSFYRKHEELSFKISFEISFYRAKLVIL